MHSFTRCMFVVAAINVGSRAQLTNFAGSTTVSVNPIDATCGRKSAENYCWINLVAGISCANHTCRTVCTDASEQGPSYSHLLRDVSGFNFDNSVTSTSRDFGSGRVTVAIFNKKSRLAFLKGALNITGAEDIILSFRIRPDNMDLESSLIDIHGVGYEQRVLNVRLGSDLGLTIVSGRASVTDQSWGIPRHAWSHIAIQCSRNGTTVYLNGSKTSQTDHSFTLRINTPSDLKTKIGQSFAGDVMQTHRVTSPGGCTGSPTRDFTLTRDDSCQAKANGWYALHNIGYMQCVDGRRLNVGTCGSRSVRYGRMGFQDEQCNFCTSSCQCEVQCTPGNTKESCDALGFVCRDGESKPHSVFCDEYYVCRDGEYLKRKCEYPERWSVEHERCEALQTVDCGKRIPKYHPCDRLNTYGTVHGAPECYVHHYYGNCTGQEDGLYYKKFYYYCGLYGCHKNTLVGLNAEHSYSDRYKMNCPDGYGVNPATGRCEQGAECSNVTTLHAPNSPYLICMNGQLRSNRYDCRYFWRCQNGQWMVERCQDGLVWSHNEDKCVSDTAHCSSNTLPETLDLNERQFIGQLADMRLYEVRLSESHIHNLYDPLISCKRWGRDAHPVAYVTDTDPSTYWLSRAGLPSVDLTFDLKQIYKLEEISLTFFGPVPLIVSIFKTVTTDDSWQMWRVFRDDCSGVSRCTLNKRSMQLDGERLTYNLLKNSLGPLQRRASAVRVRLSGHRHVGIAQLQNISYFGLYSIAISRREFRRCGTFSYIVYASSASCLPCDCDVRGTVEANVECNEIGGQCACKRYVTGRRCDQCLSGYDNVRESDPNGCSDNSRKTTAVFDENTSSLSNNEVATTTSFRDWVSLQKNSTTEGPSTQWLLYTVPVYIVTVVVIVIIIAVICVRSRRRQQHNEDNETGTPATAPEPAYDRPTPEPISDAAPDYTLMTRPGSDKVQRRLAREAPTTNANTASDEVQPANLTQSTIESDYVEVS